MPYESLLAFDVPWHFDQENPRYLIMERDFTNIELDELFAHADRTMEGWDDFPPLSPDMPGNLLYQGRSHAVAKKKKGKGKDPPTLSPEKS